MAIYTQSLNKISDGTYEQQINGVLYKFITVTNGFGYYVDNVYSGTLSNIGSIDATDVTSQYPNHTAFSLSAHQGYFIINNSNANSDGLFYGETPLVSGQNPTPQPTPSTDIDTGMGAAYYEEDLTTNVKKYFAESFKFDGSQFEMDGDRIVGLKQSFIDTLATDLTNIVNTSISTATLTADVATINQTLTALGINTDLLKTKDLRLVDAQGHEHKIHLGN